MILSSNCNIKTRFEIVSISLTFYTSLNDIISICNLNTSRRACATVSFSWQFIYDFSRVVCDFGWYSDFLHSFTRCPTKNAFFKPLYLSPLTLLRIFILSKMPLSVVSCASTDMVMVRKYTNTLSLWYLLHLSPVIVKLCHSSSWVGSLFKL